MAVTIDCSNHSWRKSLGVVAAAWALKCCSGPPASESLTVASVNRARFNSNPKGSESRGDSDEKQQTDADEDKSDTWPQQLGFCRLKI